MLDALPTPSSDKLRILLVEDDPVFLEIMRHYLQRADNIEVDTAMTIAAGLKKAHETPFDAVLLDLILPDSWEGLSGLDQFTAAFPNLPILVLTGLEEETLATEALRKGAQDYLIKSNTRLDVLLRSIQYAIYRKQSEVALKNAQEDLERRVQERTTELNIVNEILKAELAEVRFHESQSRRYRFIANASKDLMTLISRDYMYEAVNDAYCIANNKPREALVGRTVPDVWGAARFDGAIREHLDQALNGEENMFQGWFTFFSLGRRFMQVTYYPFQNPHGEVTHVVVVSHDMTEQRDAENQLRQQAERLQYLTQQLVTAQEDERKRISRELHDEASQMLIALQFGLQRVMMNIPSELETPRTQLEGAIELARDTTEQLRHLAHNLRPPSLDALGLNEVLRGYCNNFSDQTGLDVNYQGENVENIVDNVQVSLYRFLQEALTNVIKHANATKIEVALQFAPPTIRLIVKDNGRGFPAEETAASGIGLMGMEERLHLLGGELTLENNKTGGASLIATIPQDGIRKN